jgi:hypothetical protein
VSCSSLSLAAGERLAGTASIAARWLLVEVRSSWGRDAVGDTDLDGAVRKRLEGWLADEEGSRVLFVRRPGSRGETTTVFSARSDEDGGELRRLTLPSLRALADADLGAGDPIAGPLILVCGHGRRDPCCARHGRPVFEALQPHATTSLLWQSSHQGGHRFAANVLVLPAGISLGRVPAEAAASVAATVAAGRIPLAYFRGRTIYAPEAQAAEAAVRERLGLAGLGEVRLHASSPGRVVLTTPAGLIEVTVEARAGPLRPESCGADPVPARVYDVRV